MLHSLVQKQFNGHLHTLRGGGRVQGTEGQTALGAPGPYEHLHRERDVQALPPAALGCGLPGHALCDDCGSGHHRGSECDYAPSFTDHHHESTGPPLLRLTSPAPEICENVNSCVSYFDAKAANTTCFGNK